MSWDEGSYEEIEEHVDPRVAKHIAYWITLQESEREQFRREWPWFADLLDGVTKAHVGRKHSLYRGLARAAQITDHFNATRGNTLPEEPSLSRLERKGQPHSSQRQLRSINERLRQFGV